MTAAILRRIAIALMFLSVPFASLAFAGDPHGTWLTDDGKARIRVADCGGALCGNIIWLKEPNDETGKPKTDQHNADAAKRSRPILGVPIVLGMKPTSTPDKWAGEVYNAEDGKTYSGSITLIGPSKLNLEGCALGGLVCKTKVWTRAN